jgi:single-strand DNA-binding protein
MAISKNYTSLIGYLGNTPELRETKTSGTDVTSFSLAMNEEFENRRGQRVEQVTWVKIRVWDRRALPVVDYLKKGSLVEVEGKIVEPEWWEDDDGEIRVTAVVEARNVRFLDRVPADYEEDTEDEEEDEQPRRRRGSGRRSQSTSERRRSGQSSRQSSNRRERESEAEDGGKSNRMERLRDLNRNRRQRNQGEEEVEELSARKERSERSERKDRQSRRVPFSRNKA